MFKLNPVLLGLIAAQGMMFPALNASAAILKPYAPESNDNKSGVYCLCNGSTQTLSGLPQFSSGESGLTRVTLGDLQRTGRIIDDNLTGQERINIGQQNLNILIPDFENNTYSVYPVYDSLAFSNLPAVDLNTEVPDYYAVKDRQYIDARVASVSNGTINIDIGQQGATTRSSTNSWSMAAKQSQLFTASKRGQLNWNSDNRITFTAAAPPYNSDRLAFNLESVARYTGVFTINTLDGGVSTFNVTSLAGLRDYNDWLINQLANRAINPEDYSSAFHKAFTLYDGSVAYRLSPDILQDEVAQPSGDQVVLSADGPDARVKISAGKTLEVVNSSSAAVRASNGATAIVDGKLATTGPAQLESRGLELINGSTGINNGVINGGFLNNADGEGVDSSTLGYVGKAVAVTGGSNFTNNGVINLAAGDAPSGGRSDALWIDKSSAVNHGNINLGVADVSNGNSAAGVSLGGEASFINAEEGTLYIGRSPQNHKPDNTQDVAVNLSGGVSAIRQTLNASAINNGRIVIGSKVQNAVGMRVETGPDALALNNGTIDVNGRAQVQPAENIGLLALDAGSGGRVGNTGTINLNGDNSTGIKAIATHGNSASVYSTGTINVNGNADAAAGTNNTAVWVIGQDGGRAKAELSGPVYLNGNAAIGLRAEGNAVINVAAGAIPHSAGGQDQISFFTTGPDARINLPTNGHYVTSSPNGTLFRLLDGANFDARGMTLSLNAPGATGVTGSGRDSDIFTHGATFNMGAYGTGVKIEGGAQGTIDAATRLRLTGEGSSAATVDGDKHDLRGNVINPDVASDATTLLTNHAPISGLGNAQLGLLALAQAQLVNTGDITLGGEGSTGIAARFGATVTNSGDISVTRGGTGLYSEGYASPDDNTIPTEVTNNGTLNVYGIPGSTQPSTYGAIATGARSILNQNGIINLYGDNAVGGIVASDATINTGSTSSVVFHNDNQTGYQVRGADSIIFGSGGNTNVNTNGSTLYQLSNGGDFYALAPATVTLSGANSTGVSVSGEGSLIYRSDVFNVNGSGAAAIRVYDLGEAIITSAITLNGDNTLGAVSTGDRATIYAASQITGNGSNIAAFDVSYNAAIFNQYQGVVDLSGPNSTGVRVHDSGTFINYGSVHVASGTGIDVTSGYGYYNPVDSQLRVDDGIAALRVGSDAGLQVYGDGQGYSTLSASGSADGLLLDSGAQWFEANDVTLGAYGSGNAINNRAETDGIMLQNVRLETGRGAGIRSAVSFDAGGSAQIYVGSGGTGYLFAHEDGSTTSNDLLIGEGYSIVVPGEGTGVRANTTGRVIARGTIDIQSARGGSAIVTSTASQVINQGTIASQSVAAPIIDLRGGESVFINEGTIAAPNPETVVVAGGATSDVIALLDGKAVGDVNTGNGNDSLLVSGGTLDGSLTMGNGTNVATVQKVSLANTRHITTDNGAGSTLNLSDITARGGSFASDDLRKGTNLGAGWSTLNFYNTMWTLTDHIKLAHSTINVDGNSTLFAGNGVNPLLQGAENDSLVVSNAGTLDLTNGGSAVNDSLTINGDLVSAQGNLRLNSAATQSDILRVNGSVSGTTRIEDSLTGSPLMDGNRDGVIAATEGVSLAQVSGNASAGSFVLPRGYVASGPWQYSLYSFAPGSSDASQRQLSGSGDDFWDYRLANAFVCEAGSLCQPQTGSGRAAVRPAVTPQVPSYLSTPVGLAYYQLATTDDLHKRLGELRHQQGMSDTPDGEMFIRYLGSNLKYQSDRGLSDYGYDFDLDYSAVQLGGNLLHIEGAQDSLRGGIAYTRGNTRIRPHAADGYSSTAFDSDSLALYGTWQRTSGLYVDGSLAWNWHRGETDIARQKAVASPKGDGWTASLESGYPFEFSNGLRIEPQAQLTYLRVNMDSFTDRDRTFVSYENYDQTIGRLGARMDHTWQDESLRQYTPYIRTNYYQSWGGAAKTKVSAGDSNISQTFTGGRLGQMWDIGVGGTTTFRNAVSLYAEADYRKEIDGNGVKGWHYNAGVRWTF
ncbi:autotransporter outer membrane beta-barrel domain-containing protein [Erwinia sp. P6884]|uniref:autotransporter outer membrane beta-barrel domain-containing protein n=1 Tax=Erwinia sp. P6884 TaxID=3141450 RepID=UPI003198C6DB